MTIRIFFNLQVNLNYILLKHHKTKPFFFWHFIITHYIWQDTYIKVLSKNHSSL